MRVQGFIFCSGVKDAEGHAVELKDAVRYGWIKPGEVPRGFKLPAGCVPIGANLFLDSGRQYATYAFGFRTPVSSYTLQQFQVGTGTRAVSVTDVALQNPVPFALGAATKQVDAVEFNAPYSMRVVYTLGVGDCNGYLITEFGLMSGDSTLVARSVKPGINKTSDYSPTFGWYLRF
jgi:hypothetical protein